MSQRRAPTSLARLCRYAFVTFNRASSVQTALEALGSQSGGGAGFSSLFGGSLKVRSARVAPRVRLECECTLGRAALLAIQTRRT